VWLRAGCVTNASAEVKDDTTLRWTATASE